MPKGEEEAEIRYNLVQNFMFERAIAASDYLRSSEIICFPTKIPFLAQNLALNTKETKPGFSLSPDCTFIRQGIFTHLLCSIPSWSLGMKCCFFLQNPNILKKCLKRLLEQQRWLWRWVTKCRMDAPVSQTTGNFVARKKQYHRVKRGNLFALIGGALLSTARTLESDGTGPHVLECQNSRSHREG